MKHALPPGLMAAADGQKLECDVTLRNLVGALRGDLDEGFDPTFLWYSISTQFSHDSPTRLAVALAAAVLQLAQKPTTHPKGTVGKSVFGHTGICGCCGYKFHGPHDGVVKFLDRHMRTGWLPKKTP